MAQIDFISYSPDDTKQFAASFARILTLGDVIAFTGDLGAGKTTFTSGLVHGLGCIDWVSSPTFSLVQEYRGPVPVCHFDFYRICDDDDLFATGYYDYLKDQKIIVVEWSENVPEAIPSDAFLISMEVINDTTRKITVRGDDRLESFSN